ncbi:MAG TPA: hypothetical protein PK468_11595 [Candidatus Hydrogenedentes bacterium]|nr:hypothetical protein [Candidatus Hydrogenedentota bacterium]
MLNGDPAVINYCKRVFCDLWSRSERGRRAMNKASKSKHREYVFKMDAYSIETLPMNRLAEYMSDLATIFGEHKQVHFVRLKKGSVALNIRVDNEAEPKVRNRIRLSKQEEGPPEARTAIQNLNKRLAEDNASGALLGPNEENILQFPGKELFAGPTIGPIRQPGALDGVPIRVGGRGRRPTVPVHLEGLEGQFYNCSATREIARGIAKHMFQTPLRVSGIGQWFRGADGEWEMRSFAIHEFREIEGVSLSETVQHLRAIDLHVERNENLLDALADIRSGS